MGWVLVLLGTSLALGIALLFGAVHAALVGLALSLPLLAVSLILGLVLIRRGGSLDRAGIRAEQETRAQALLGLMGHRGAVTARDAAHALGVSIAEADQELTDLAKREPDRVAVDVDDEGVVRYRLARIAEEVRSRVEMPQEEGGAGAELDVAEREGEGEREGAREARGQKKEVGR
jgi:hypothetical protein